MTGLYDDEFDDSLPPVVMPEEDETPMLFTDNNGAAAGGDDDDEDEGDWRKFVGAGHGEEYHVPEAEEVPLSSYGQDPSNEFEDDGRLRLGIGGANPTNHDEGCL